MAYDPNSAILIKQYEKAHARLQTDIANLREEVSNTITSVYKAAGSLPFASLTSELLVKANEGKVYNITDAFTSTADFVEGAGKKYTAGTNVVIIETTTAVFSVSSDSTVDAEKTYSVVTPAGNEDPATEGWYELTTPAVYKFDVHAGDLSNMMTLTVPAKPNSIPVLNEHGQVVDSGIRIATDEEFDEMLAGLYGE